ncbi:MAG: hypothetical protein ACO1PB_18860 [Ramlibacter sp.]
MTERSLRDSVGVFIIVANLAVIGCTFFLYFLGGFLFDELTTTIALLVPMFSVYTTAIVKSFVSGRRRTRVASPQVTPQYVFISWIFPIAFTTYLIALVVLKAFNVGFSSFEQFKSLLIASEAVFGVYIGLILSSMFSIPKDRLPATPGKKASGTSDSVPEG